MARKAVEHRDLEFRTCDTPEAEDVLQKRELIKQEARHGDMKRAKAVFAFNLTMLL